MAELPLFRRFPGLAAVPRVSLGKFPTPVQRLEVEGRPLLVKRDDLSGETIGGNKLRGAEWLLGAVRRGERVVTVGPRGSSHALTIARCATQLGCATTVARWNQEMNAAALRVAALLEKEAQVVDARRVAAAYAVATWHRARGARWIPAGGASPLAILGHVNSALELADQIARGDCELPDCVVVPLGTGGTAAGLALGLCIAGLPSRVVAVRVVPRIVGRASRVRRLGNAVASLMERRAGTAIPRLQTGDFDVDDGFYAGGYGTPLNPGVSESTLERVGIRLDDTYSRKAFAAAIERSDNRKTLFWLTFDGRILGERGRGKEQGGRSASP